MSNFISKSTLTLSTAPCRALLISGALPPTACLFVTINLEMKLYGR